MYAHRRTTVTGHVSSGHNTPTPLTNLENTVLLDNFYKKSCFNFHWCQKPHLPDTFWPISAHLRWTDQWDFPSPFIRRLISDFAAYRLYRNCFINKRLLSAISLDQQRLRYPTQKTNEVAGYTLSRQQVRVENLRSVSFLFDLPHGFKKL